MGGDRKAEPVSPQAADVVAYALFFGMLGGLAEAVRAVAAIAWTHRATGEVVAPEVFWMAPLAAVLVLLAVAGLFVVASRLTGRAAWLSWAPPVLAALVAFSFMRSLSLGLHPIATGVLAAGAGAAIGRAIEAGGHAMWRGVAWRLSALGVIAATAWGLWIPQSRAIAERRATEALPPAEAGAPNVLLIVWDTVRALSLSLHGHERETTPTLDALAASSVVFDRAVASAPWTLPSHATLFTGLYEHQHGATRDSPLGPGIPTLAEALSSRGFRTGGFAANTYWLGRPFGLHRGFQWYEDSWFEDTGDGTPAIVEGIARSWWISNAVYRSTGSQARRRRRIQNVPAGRVNEAVLEWLDRIGDERPFFAFLNLYDAHEPYVAREPTGFRFSDGEPRYWWDYTRPDTLSATDLVELREAYDATIFHLDYRLNELLEALDSRGRLDNTLVIVTSDHGETIGEHAPDHIGHSKFAYYDVLNVPLVFHFPRRLAGGVRHRAPVSHVDVAATVLDVVDGAAGDSGRSGTGSAQTRPGRGPTLPGVSLVPLLMPADTSRSGILPSPALSQGTPADWQLEFDRWPVARGPLFSLIEGDDHYVIDARGEQRLYDLEDDPWWAENLAERADSRPRLSAMKARVEEMIGRDPVGGGR